jgi:S1-C subfamily serine protease
MTVNRYDYGAIYFVKVRMPFGAYFRDLSDAERGSLETNKGAAVALIVDGSPAYNCDVLVGDIVLAVNGERVSGARGMLDLIQRYAGQVANLMLVRNGKEISKTVPIGEP